jgi:hypothetical protein
MIGWRSLLWSKKYQKAADVVAKPSGTGTPFPLNRLNISPKEAFLPPTEGMSESKICLNGLMYDSMKIEFFYDFKAQFSIKNTEGEMI